MFDGPLVAALLRGPYVTDNIPGGSSVAAWLKKRGTRECLLMIGAYPQWDRRRDGARRDVPCGPRRGEQRDARRPCL